MATTVARLEAVLGADTKAFDAAMDRSEGKMHNVRKAAGLAGAGIAFGLGVVAKVGWDELKAAEKVTAQTNAVLKSTGGLANVTAKHVDKLATSISNYSGMDDEAVQAGENMLLTFRDIRNRVGENNNIFDQATVATADLAQAMGMDATKAALQLGKALNDPSRGMSRLQRIGVTFTQGQKDAAKHLMETGHTAEAQKIILAELTKEFGGSAKAAGQTLGGQLRIARERFSDVSGEIVKTLLPAFMALSGILIKATKYLSEHKEVAKILFIGLGLLAGVLFTISASMKIAAAAVKIYTAAQWLMNAALDANPIGLVIIALAALAVGVVVAYKKFKPFREAVNDAWGILQSVFDWVKDHWKELAVLLAGPFAPIVAAGTDAFGVRTAIVKTFDSIKSFIADFPSKVTNFISALKSKIVGWLTSSDIGGYFSSVVGGWVAFVTGMPGRVTDFIAALKKKIVGFFTTNAIGDYISSIVGGWVGFITGLPGRVGDFVVALKNKIVGFFINADIGGYITAVVAGWIGTIGDLPGKAGAAITAGAKALKKAVTDLFGNVIDWVKKALGISSPSAVFHEMGRQSVQGFINGVGSMAGVLKNAVVGMVKSLPGRALGAVEGAVGAIGGEIKSAPGEHSVGSAEKYLVPWAQQEGITVTSIATGNHVKGSYHYQHRAIDVDGGYSKNRDFFADSINHFGAKNITELFFDPMGYYIKNGQRIKGAIGGHGDHVHIALAKGGIIRRPMFAMMGEEGPEAVIPLSPNRRKEAAGILRQISPQVGLQSWQDKTLEFFKSLWNVAKPFYGGAAMPMLNFVEKGIDITRSFVSGPSHGPNTPGSRTVNWTHAASNALFGNKESMRQWALDAALHEWTHIFQKPGIFGTPWKAEGGAVDFVRMMGKKIYSMLGIDYTPGSVGGQYEGWATRVMKELGPTWVLRDQFRDPRAVAGLKSAVFDKGGWLQPGLTLAANNTGRPEPVGGGGNVTINYNGTIIHEREAEQRIVDLLARAQRRGPLGLSGGFA